MTLSGQWGREVGGGEKLLLLVREVQCAIHLAELHLNTNCWCLFKMTFVCPASGAWTVPVTAIATIPWELARTGFAPLFWAFQGLNSFI